MTREVISGPNFSGRSDALRAKLAGGGAAFVIGPYAEAALSGLATTVADEITVYRADPGAARHVAFVPLDLAIYADRKPQTLSGGEQVLLALQCFAQSAYGRVGIDTALEQLDSGNRIQALEFLSRTEGDVTLIDNRMTVAPPGWTSLACQPERPALPCDLEALVAGLAPCAAPRIAIRDLDFAYRQGADVFQGAGLTLEPGRAYRLFGRNGAGKTTLLKILVGVLAPRRGEVLLGEQSYTPWRDGNAAFALATQNPDHQWCGATLREDIQRRRAGLRSGDVDPISDARVASSAQKLGVTSLDQHLYELPLAARKRLSWLWPFTGVMPWIMLDEPTIGQDRDMCRALAAALTRFCSLGHGLVFVTHDDDFARQVAHQVVTIENRRVSLN
jgi:energy-coupling factor transporter ATP-binding protein EcfA2